MPRPMVPTLGRCSGITALVTPYGRQPVIGSPSPRGRHRTPRARRGDRNGDVAGRNGRVGRHFSSHRFLARGRSDPLLENGGCGRRREFALERQRRRLRPPASRCRDRFGRLAVARPDSLRRSDDGSRMSGSGSGRCSLTRRGGGAVLLVLPKCCLRAQSDNIATALC